jgi:hypothetical protein
MMLPESPNRMLISATRSYTLNFPQCQAHGYSEIDQEAMELGSLQDIEFNLQRAAPVKARRA